MSLISKKLAAQLKTEKDAVNLYTSFAKRIGNPRIRDRITKIKNDEIEHVRLAKEMISIISNYKKRIKTAKTGKKAINLKGFIDDFSSLFIAADIDQYPNIVIRIINELKINCIYLSFNKMPKYINKLLAGYGIDTDRIKFISCVKFPGRGIFTDPEDLTSLSIVLGDLIKGIKGRSFVFVDTISAFPVYHELNTILRFVSSVNSKVENYGSGIIWLAIDESEKELNSKIASLCDKVIRP